MVDFRKAILLLAVLVFATGLASAQQTLNCTLNGGAPPLLRAEGVAEEVGQAFIACSGGSQITPGQPVHRINIRVFISGYNITSRWVGGSSSLPMLESMLLIDDPLPAQQVWGHSTFPTTLTCNAPYDPTRCGNVFAATTVGGNNSAIEWRDIPFEPSTTTRVLRFVNIRVNAAQPTGGNVSSLIPPQVQMFVSISGTLTLPISTPFLAVGYIQNGLSFSTDKTLTFSQCGPRSTSSSRTLVTTFNARFTEGFPNAFRPQYTYTGTTVNPQNNLNQIYNTESMFFPAPSGGSPDAGRATQGTRLRLAFSGIPSGVVLAVPTGTFTSGTVTLQLVASESNITTQLGLGNTVALTGGAGVVVYEVLSAQPGTTETVAIPVDVYYSALPGLTTTGSVNGTFAPLSTSDIGGFDLPVPRFYQTTAQQKAFSVVPCETRLLFPFVASISGYDTGIAIANTSKDPFNTPGQSGACTLSFYGTPGDSSQTSAVIGPGQVLTMILSSGNSAQGLSPVPNFVGYVFAKCDFQYAHGYAFISDPGVNKFAQGYIALVLESSSGTLKRGPSNAVESLGN